MKCIPTSDRKVCEELECPIDNININTCKGIYPLLNGIHPNYLTVMSFIFGLLACYYLTEKKYTIAGVLLYIGYFFDCCDGNYARTTRQETALGDFLDHSTDVIVYTSVMYILYKQGEYTCLFLVILFLSIGVPQMLFQECSIGGSSSTLTMYTNLGTLLGLTPERCEENMKYSRYFGFGMSNLLILLLFIYMDYRK